MSKRSKRLKRQARSTAAKTAPTQPQQAGPAKASPPKHQRQSTPRARRGSEAWSRTKKIAVLLVGGLPVIGTMLALPAAWPKFSITPADLQDSSQPFSQAFEIKNESLYPLYQVRITTFSGMVTAQHRNIKLDMGMNSIRRAPLSRMDPGDPVTVPLQIVSFPQLPKAAEAGIEIEYRPLNLFSMVKLFRFTLARKYGEATFSWRRQPITDEFEAKWSTFKAEHQ